MARTVVIGFLGTTLDARQGAARWDGWRPTVDLCRHEDLEVHRLELLHPTASLALAELVAADVRSVSPATEVRLVPFDLDDPWDFAEVYGRLHAFAAGYAFDEERESYLVHITTGTHVAQICLFLLTETRHFPARLLKTSPPDRRSRGRSEPGSLSVIDLDLSRYDQLAERFAAERRAGVSFLKDGVDTRNAAFNRRMDELEQVAVASDAPILLTGPTGVGKTQLARRIHELKRRHHRVVGRLVEANCATLRGDAATSALFGHVKGAFTGAVAARTGLLAAADGGMLFLDEIGELGLDEQAMLLRALEEGLFLPLGSDEPRTSRFQLVAGTNRDLGEAVRAGRFREDLLARIDLWSFELPPLRERLEDVEPNLDWELARLSERTGRSVSFNREARERFLAFATDPSTPWRANFRDFNAALTRMATLAPRGRIGVPVVDGEIARLRTSWSRLDGGAGAADGGIVDEVLGERARDLDLFDRVQLALVLQVCRRSPSLSAAGRALFARSRERKSSSNDADRLSKYLARFGLAWRDVGRAGER